MYVLRLLSIALTIFSPAISLAAPIFYTATDLVDEQSGSDLWRYEYFVANESGFALDSFNIIFDIDRYDFNLVATPLGDEVDAADYTTPDGWEGIVFPDDPFLSEDGVFAINQIFFDPLTEILATDAITGFSVDFIWRGSGSPGSQSFEAFSSADPFGLPVVEGMTQLRVPPIAVSEPGTGILAGMGLLALIARRKLSFF